jgi:hypothetical protein
MLEEAHMVLRRPPQEPPRSAKYLFGRYLDSDMNWYTFLEGW